MARRDKRSKEMENGRRLSVSSSIIVDLVARCSGRLGSCLTASRRAKAIDQGQPQYTTTGKSCHARAVLPYRTCLFFHSNSG